MEKDKLISILNNKNNDFYRNTCDINDNMYIHDTQINTAKKLITELASNVLRTNHVMLVAPMQSGKTATCVSVINIINKSLLFKHMGIKKYLFISGMNDCGLRTQTFERVKKQVIDADTTNTICGTANLTANSKYIVLKNSDLLNYKGSLNGSLIFIDESHFGSNENNILTKFLIKFGIDWKNKNDLIKRNIYIVSISATPFDELVSDQAKCKKIVTLTPSSDYVGVSDFLAQDVVFDADKDDIQEDGAIFDYITDAHWRMQDNHENGVIFIRTRHFDIIQNHNYVKTYFDIFTMDSSVSKLQYDILYNKLNALYNRQVTKPLIVLIKGAFRAGMTIDTKFKNIIYMIYDYSVRADSTAQALLGRMCGYRTSKDVSKTYFYLNKKFADMYSLWSNDFTNTELIPCNKQEWGWVDNGYVGDDVTFGSRPCGNFKVPLSDNEIISLYKEAKGRRNLPALLGNKIDSILKKNNFDIKYDYIMEIQANGKNNYAKSSQEKRFNSFSKDSLVFQFRPEKIKKFIADTHRDYLTKEDIGKRCISVVLDTEIYDTTDGIYLKGNRQLLVYYVEVGQKQLIYSRKGQYKPHKDTTEVN